MKLDKKYSSIYECPKTSKRVRYGSMMDSRGICEHCGHNSGSSITHAIAVSGLWLRPSFIEWIYGQRKKLIRYK